VALGTLTLHGDSRDIQFELIRHETAARLVRLHTGRWSATEVLYRGEDIDEESFDGSDGIASLDFAKVVSLEWQPYPVADGAKGGDELTIDEWTVLLKLIDSARRRAAHGTAAPAGEGPEDDTAAASPTGDDAASGGSSAPDAS
jgi:hypothetical protein